MSGDSNIEWTDKVWNPVTGCTKVSDGCRNCYAERMSKRLKGRCGYPADNPFKVTLHTKRLDEPLRWRKPKRIFVCSMGDLFHEDVPFEFILKAFDRMQQSPQHTFLVLTKRPQRMLDFCATYGIGTANEWPSNIVVGTSVEDQATADERIPLLLKTPAAKRFVSYEPALGPVDFREWFFEPTGNFRTKNGKRQMELRSTGNIDQIIMGGESGPKARPMHPDWARSVRDQCKAAGVAFFFKQWGEWSPFYDRDIDDPDWRDIPKESSSVRRLNLEGGCGFHGERVVYFKKVGKKAAGAGLDGEEYKEVLG